MLRPRKSRGPRTQEDPIVVPMGSTEDDGSAEICSEAERDMTFGTVH